MKIGLVTTVADFVDRQLRVQSGAVVAEIKVDLHAQQKTIIALSIDNDREIVVKKWLWPSQTSSVVTHQNAFKRTGSSLN